MGVHGRREGQERAQAAATPVVELDDGPDHVQVQDKGGDNNRESSSPVQGCHHWIRMPQLHTFVSLPSHQADGTNQLFYLFI
jgi:hypothetical protein